MLASSQPIKALVIGSLTTRIRCIMSLNIEDYAMSTEERNSITDEYLDEMYEEVTINGCTFPPSRILFELDPTAYRCLTADLMSELAPEDDE